jgi:hypothetical protein
MDAGSDGGLWSIPGGPNSHRHSEIFQEFALVRSTQNAWQGLAAGEHPAPSDLKQAGAERQSSIVTGRLDAI